MKTKIALIGIFGIAMLLIFIRNVNVRMNEKNIDSMEQITADGIKREEAAKQLAVLNYSLEECEKLKYHAVFSDVIKTDVSSKYINALLIWGILGEPKAGTEFRPNDSLTYGESFDYYNAIAKIQTNENEKQGLEALSFNLKTVKKGDEISKSHWQELYELMLNDCYKSDKNETYTNQIVLKDVYIIEISEPKDESLERINDNKSEYAVITDSGSYQTRDLDMKSYLDREITVLLKENQIISVFNITDEPIVLENVWIIKNKGKEIQAFVNGVKKTFYSKNNLSENIEKVVGDLEIVDQKVNKVSIKPDIINGKILVANDSYIELEGYGKLKLEDSYRIYKLYDELSMELTNGILVGYQNTDFVISSGKICAALIKESIKAENIRVLIKTNGFEELFHDSVKVTASVPFTIYYGKKEKTYEAFKTVSINENSKLLKNGRLKIETDGDDNKIKLLSIDRNQGNPEYRGIIEIEKRKSGLTIINELPLEEYLYGVLPSEMPVSYGLEALKVQAVCARSYAFNQLMDNKYGAYGAHVDDSVTFQVYNNIGEYDDSTLAVKETYGKVLEYKNKVISAYYFSTSCGHTSSADSVWMSNRPIQYLTGKLQTLDDKKEIDLTDEGNFEKFIKEKAYTTYDSEFPWYRWSVKLSADDIKGSIDKKLKTRYNANPSLILTLSEGEYVSKPIDTVGTIVDIRVGKRETGGIVTELIIKGSKNTVKVFTEYNIRILLAPIYDKVIRQDGSEISNLSMLPSAFVFFDKKKEEGKLTQLAVTGGGYGHGVGMSQNGVKAMTDLGKDYEQILNHYYDGTELEFIY